MVIYFCDGNQIPEKVETLLLNIHRNKDSHTTKTFCRTLVGILNGAAGRGFLSISRSCISHPNPLHHGVPNLIYECDIQRCFSVSRKDARSNLGKYIRAIFIRDGVGSATLPQQHIAW